MKFKLISLLLVLFLFQAVYTLDCPDGSGPRTKGATECTSCAGNCRVCEYGFCLVCQENYVSTDGYSCDACPEGQYSDPNQRENPFTAAQKVCQNCADAGCRRCSGLNLGQCVSCLEGLYWDQTRKVCKKCDDPYCKQCSGPGTGQCNICFSEAYSTPQNTCSLCGTGQNTGTIGRATAEKCKYCQEDNCVKCFWTMKGICSACKPGYSLSGVHERQMSCVPFQVQHCETVNGGRCVDCMVGYIMDGRTGNCAACKDTNCAKCDNLNSLSCSSCLPGYYLKSDKSCGVCEDNGCSSCNGAGQNQCKGCKQGLTLVGSNCIPCDLANCVSCDSSQKCSACKNGYYLENNQCKYCGNGSASPIGAILKSQCDICKSSGDLTCSLPSSGTAAVTCKPGYGITVFSSHPSWTECVRCPLDCKSCDTTDSKITDCNTCNLGYYLNEKQQCSPCQDNNCDQCSAEGEGKCTSCKFGFLLENGQCNAVCSDSNCATCSGPRPNACTLCLSGFRLNKNGQCEACGTGCDTCSSSGKCLSCTAGYYSNINDGTCQKCSPFLSSSAGSTSISDCFKCADDKCISCNAKNTGSCEVCTDGYVADHVTKKCIRCFDQRCLKCKTTGSGRYITGICTKCSPGYFPNGEICEPCADENCNDCFGPDQGKCSACKDGYFTTKENICKSCEDEGCTSCSVAGTGKCSACAPDYYLKDNKCMRCSQGKSSPPNSKSIEACITCNDQFCDSCHGQQGIGTCRACIPEYFVTKSKNCQHCDDKACLACLGPKLRQCTTCAANYQLSTRSTCDPCPDGMSSKAGGFCESCGDGGCRACDPTNLDQCLNCLPGFYLKNKQCIACEEGKYPSDRKFGGTGPSYCRDCDMPHCTTCSGPGTAPGTCKSCKEGFVLNEVGFCMPCQDKGCKACLWTGTRQCATCEANYYLQDNECTPCEEGKFSPAGSTKLEDCQKIQMKSSSILVALGVVGVILALGIVFLWKKTNIFGSKKAPGLSNISNSPANTYDQLQEIEESSNSKHRIELGSLNQKNNS